MTSQSPETRITEVAKWTDQPVQLKDFVGKYPVPNIVKVTKGQYRNIGFAKSVHSHLYLFSASTGRKILAESVKLKEGKRAILSDQKYAVPLSYQGWFEVLSEDGKAVKAIESVKELSTTFNFSKNSKYLVRENVKAFSHNENGDISMDKNRVIHVGDVITVTGEMWRAQTTSKGMARRKLLSCVDNNGESFYFDFDQKGLFSPVAGQQNISGVHNVQAMLQKFRLPITVRLVNGIIPTKLEKHFTGVFRLLHIYSDETAFLCPLKKDSKMVPVSTREPLKLVHVSNFEEVKALEEFEQVHERCANMYNSFMNSIHVLFSLPEPEVNGEGGRKGDNKKVGPEPNIDPEEENILFEEVEDIYQYVRDGGPVPPAPRPRPMKSKQPPPLPDKKGSTKTKLAFLGKSIVNKFSSKERESGSQAIPKESNSAVKASSPKQELPPQIPDKIKNSIDIPVQDSTDGSNNRKIVKKLANGEWDWEEPIYEPLEKIRNQKKYKDKKREEIQLDTSPKLLSDPTENFKNDFTDNATNPFEAPPVVASASDPSAVQNLRQIYKQHSLHDIVSSGSQNSLEKSKDSSPKPVVKEITDQGITIPEPDYEDNPYNIKAPPVPPKHFDITDIPSNKSHSSGSGKEIAEPTQQKFRRSKSQNSGISTSDSAVHRPISTTTVTVTTNSNPNVHGYQVRRPSQKHLPRGVPTTVHIEGPNAAVVSPHSGGITVPRVSIVSQNHISSHPPYVAVARVGDTYEDRYSNGRPLHRGNSDHARRKLQSMYL